MDRFWLLTWTTYGSWLPGDVRGFVSNIDRGDGKGHRVNSPSVPPVANMPGLQKMARESASSPIFLSLEQAELLLCQFTTTVDFRGWELHAVAIMRNHVHLVLGVSGDPEPDTLLRDLKSYGSRRLNQMFGKPDSKTWWTESGSRRKLPNEEAVQAAVKYVENQEHPLVTWIAPRWRRTF